MSKLFMFEKPLGMRDTLPSLYEAKKKVRHDLSEEIGAWGYHFIETPTLEYYETVGSVSAILNQQLFKLLDQEGHTLVLRPDMTAPIARVAASRLKNAGLPLRLAYDANVFRAQQREGGRPAEFAQVGIELIGDGSSSADGEVISLMIAVLKNAGLENFTVAIGHIGFVNAFFLDVLNDESLANDCRRYLYEKNYVGYKEYVKGLPISSEQQQKLLSLLNLRGHHELIEKARELTNCEAANKAITELEELWNILECYGVTDYVKIDLNLVSHMSYYTGILFEGYAENLGFILCNGGRYNHLLEKFKRPTPATGFGIRLDRLVEALNINVALHSNIHLIIFSQDYRGQAIKLAQELRQSGEKVVLQDKAGIKDLEAFTKRYREISYCTGEENR